MKPYRIYTDSSAIGGCCDRRFAVHSRRLLEAARRGTCVLLLSDVVIRELASAPPQVRAILAAVPTQAIEKVEITDEVLALRDAYLAAGIVGARWMDDATHVASATVARADAIVSWNFQHIVRLDKMKRYNDINTKRGFPHLTIITPEEALFDET